MYQSLVYRCLFALIVCFLFSGTAVKADYGYSYLTKYDKFHPVTVSDLRQLEDAIKNKAIAVRISSGTDPAVVTVKDLERLGKSLPLQCLVVESPAAAYKTGQYLRFMPNLQVLKMKTCSPEAIGFIPKTAPLKQIRCDEKFNSLCLPKLCKLTRLEDLSLSGCEISDEDLKYLWTLTHLKVIDLSQTNVTGSGLQYLAKCPQLKYLDLSYNKHLSDVALDNMKYFPDLRFLDIVGTSIGDDGFQHVAKLKKLESISFGDTRVTDRGMVALSNLSELSEVSFWRDNVTDVGMQYLAGCKKLSSLYIEGTKITDKSLPIFIKMPALEMLNVDNTAFSSAAWTELKRHKKKKDKEKPILVPSQLMKTPILCGNSVILDLNPSEIISLNKLNGRQLWSLKGQPRFRPPYLSPFKKNLVCIDYEPQLKVTALRSDTGQVAWSYIDRQVQAKLFKLRSTRVEIEGRNLFLFFASGRILCLNLDNGTILWDKIYNGISFDFSGQDHFVVQDPAKFYLKASLWRNGNDKSFVVAISKSLGNIVWQSRPLFMQPGELLIEPLIQADSLLVVDIAQPSRDYDDEPHYIYVLSKSTGHLLKIGNIPRFKLLPGHTLKAEAFLRLTQGNLFYIEQVDFVKNTGRFCSLKVSRTPLNAKIDFNVVKSSVFQSPELGHLTKEGLVVYGDRDWILLNTNDLKKVSKPKKEPPNFADKIMAITRIKQESIGNYVYANDSKQLFMSDGSGKFSCWNLQTAKKCWTFNMPLRQMDLPGVCGTVGGNYLRHSLSR